MTLGLVLATALATALSPGANCQTVDPGPQFVVPPTQFDANYFYCTVEPQILMGALTINHQTCGGTATQGCHYSDKVPAMPLQALPQAVACSGGMPVNPGDVASGTAPALNYASVSLQMSASVKDAPIYTWPTQTVPGHPVQVYLPTDTAVVNILQTWAGTAPN
jgi:hypothetical protein